MRIKKLEHNEKTYDDLRPYILRKENCCVVNPCGSGKSTIIASIIEEFYELGIIVITKQANAKAYYYEKCPIFEQQNIPVITYNRLHDLYKKDKLKSLKNIKICIFDEAHYIGANSWYDSVTELLKITEATAIGVTATPQRYEDQGSDRSIIDFFSGNSVGNYTAKDLQRKGVFIEPEYIITLASLDTEINKRIDKLNEIDDLTDKERETYISRLNELQDNWAEKECPKVVMSKVLDDYMYRPNGNKILVFSKNIEAIAKDMKYVKDILESIYPDKKIGLYEYTHFSSESVLQEFLTNDTNYINVIFSVNKICETIHIPDLNVLIFLRSSYSNRIITQQAGRVNDINNPYKSLILDMVDNLSKFGKKNNLDSLENIQKTVKKEQQENKTTVRLNLSYMYGSIGLFNKIDSLTKKYQLYDYMGATGTITQLCTIFRKDKDEVMKLIKDNQLSVYDALDTVPSQRKWSNDMLNDDSYDLLTNMDYTLTPEDNELVEKFYPYIQDIAKTKNCTDEDIIGNAALYLCNIAHKYNTENITTSQNMYFRNSIANFIVRSMRKMYDHNDMIEDSLSDVVSSGEYVSKYAELSELKDIIFELLNTLTEKEHRVIAMRFNIYGNGPQSLFSAGRILGDVSRERIRQIEAKAIRKLRHPSRSRKLKGFLNGEELSEIEPYTYLTYIGSENLPEANAEVFRWINEHINMAILKYGPNYKEEFTIVQKSDTKCEPVTEKESVESLNKRLNKVVLKTAEKRVGIRINRPVKYDKITIKKYRGDQYQIGKTQAIDNIQSVTTYEYIDAIDATVASTLSNLLNNNENPFWIHDALFKPFEDVKYKHILHPAVKEILKQNQIISPAFLITKTRDEIHELLTVGARLKAAQCYKVDALLSDDDIWFMKNFGEIIKILEGSVETLEAIKREALSLLYDQNIEIVC